MNGILIILLRPISSLWLSFKTITGLENFVSKFSGLLFPEFLEFLTEYEEKTISLSIYLYNMII